jgi:malate dehydrogenase
LGVPAILGKNGLEKIIELKLNDDEKALLEASSVAVKEVMGVFLSYHVHEFSSHV